MTEVADQKTDPVLETIRGSQDALSVRRVFGDAYEVDGLMIIPVARVAGGGGGGTGEGGRQAKEDGADASANGNGDDDEGREAAGAKVASGSGYGSGYGLGVTPIGVYQVRDGAVEWKPLVDVNRVARGGQILAAIVAICLAVVMVRRG